MRLIFKYIFITIPFIFIIAIISFNTQAANISESIYREYNPSECISLPNNLDYPPWGDPAEWDDSIEIYSSEIPASAKITSVEFEAKSCFPRWELDEISIEFGNDAIMYEATSISGPYTGSGCRTYSRYFSWEFDNDNPAQNWRIHIEDSGGYYCLEHQGIVCTEWVSYAATLCDWKVIIHYDIPIIETKERNALIALFNSTNGDNWFDNLGWKSPPLDSDGFAMPGTECGWYGIGCDGEHVTGLWLGDNNIEGNIPVEIGDLIDLTHIWFANNQLTGNIPPELVNLTNLTYLWIDNNQLTGEIPSELGNLTNLTEMYVQANRLTGDIPPEFGNLINLRKLWLASNQLTGKIPPELGTLFNLTGLGLDNNQLSGNIPLELGDLTNLTELWLHVNQLNGNIPPELGELTNLLKLGLFNNQLTGDIPFELMNLVNLEYLKICENYLFTDNDSLRDFLDSYDPGWEDCQQISPYCDFDSDLDTDGEDLSEFISSYINKIFPNADVNDDGVIDLNDIAKFAQWFGSI
jgi:hypothetical protein